MDIIPQASINVKADAARLKLIKKIDEHKREVVALEAIEKVWPADRLIAMIHYSEAVPTLGVMNVHADVPTRDDAGMYLDPFVLEPLIVLSGSGTTSIRPLNWIGQERRERYENEQTDLYPMFWEYQHRTATLRAFALVNGVRTSFRIKITEDPAQSAARYDIVEPRMTSKIVGFTLSNAPAGEVIKWWRSEKGEAHVTVWFPHEAGGAALKPKDFLAQRGIING